MYGKGVDMLRRHNLTVGVGEGPKPLRALCALGGIATFCFSLPSIVNVFSFMAGPAVYALHVYLAFFGICTVAVEAKDVRWLDGIRPWVTEWLKCLTVPAGKGAFYM
eukprot:Trichotokara_eunicae@DN8573_c0_g1_i1.p1